MQREKRVTVKDIARHLNISMGTVSKALSGKPGISKKMRSEIYETAVSMGYHVNRLAQSLARKPIRIGIVYPAAWAQYYNELIKGMKKALEQLKDFNITGNFMQFSSLYSTDELFSIINGMIKDEVDAVILCPASVTCCESCLQKLDEHNIPFLLVGNDFPSSNRISCIRVNADMAGRLAAELMNYFTSENSNVIAFIGDKDVREHMEKMDGFRSGLTGGRNLAGFYETQDEPEIAAHLAQKSLAEIPNVQGIFVATGNSAAICDILSSNEQYRHIRMVATDLFPDSISYLKNGTINAIIFQHPEKQGEEAIMQCYRFITEKKISASLRLIDPSVIFRSHLMK